MIAADTPLAEYISAPVSVLANGRVALGLLAAAVAAGVAVSLYPAWYITSFPPAFVIKGSFQSSAAGRLLRTVLVGMQYVISLVLIVSALFIHRQHTFMMHYEMGFDRSQLLAVTVPTEVFSELRDGEEQPLAYTRRDAFTDKLKRHPSIADVAYANGDLVAANRMGWGRDFKEKAIYFQCYPVSWNFLQMMGIEVTEGRDFTPSDEQFRYGTFIFNETARRQFELTTEDKLIGHIIDGSGERAVIAGFCRDFHFKPMQYTIEPLAFYVYGTYAWGYPSHTYIRTVPGAPVGEVRDYIRRTILEFAPTADPAQIEPVFFDEELETNYRKEKKLATLVLLFSMLSILISVMGVFGLVLFETQYRRREIGIRRVNGATVGEILALFNRKFLRIALVCTVAALPLGYAIIDRWLTQFAYRTPMVWWIFAAAAAIVVGITALTVTIRSWNAAHENPVNSIQH